MRTVAQCLAKADELDLLASALRPEDLALEFNRMALQWRDLARRALVQDHAPKP